MTTKPLGSTSMALPRAQQASALPLQATTIPATTTAANGIDISELMNMMITMMIVVMMMKMMSGMMANVA